MTPEDADQISSALRTGDVAAIAEVLAPDVIWGQCVGLEAVTRWLASVLDDAELVALTPHDDRIVLQVRLGEQEIWQVAFVANGLIIELADADDRQHALLREQTALPTRPQDPATPMRELAAVLPVANIGRALAHYRALGFETTAYDDPVAAEPYYGYGHRGEVALHFSRVDDLDPATTPSAVYLYVDDADTLYAEWRTAGVGGHFHEPEDTPYGLREGAHVDLDGNLLRFGSPI